MGTGGSLFVLSVVLSRGCQDKALEQESHRGRCSEPFWLSVATRKEGVCRVVDVARRRMGIACPRCQSSMREIMRIAPLGRCRPQTRVSSVTREMHLDTGIPLDGVCEHLTSECRQRCKNERK